MSAGRVWNREASDGSVVSVGGTWLGKGQDRMFDLCRELGMDVYPQYDESDTIMQLEVSTGDIKASPRSACSA